MQQRVPIKHFTTFPEALKAKEALKIKNPDKTYQIRSNHDGFNLVRRHSVNEIQSFQAPRTKRSKKQRKEAFLSGLR